MMIILYVLAFTTRQILSSCDYEPPFCRNENVNRYDVYKNLATRSNLYKDIDCKEYTETCKRKRVTSKLNNKRNKVKIANKLRKILLPATKKLPKNKVAALKRRLRNKNLRRNNIYTKIKGITNGTYRNYRGDDNTFNDINNQLNPVFNNEFNFDGTRVEQEIDNRPRSILNYIVDDEIAEEIIDDIEQDNQYDIEENRSDRYRILPFEVIEPSELIYVPSENPESKVEPEPEPSIVYPPEPESEIIEEPPLENETDCCNKSCALFINELKLCKFVNSTASQGPDGDIECKCENFIDTYGVLIYNHTVDGPEHMVEFKLVPDNSDDIGNFPAIRGVNIPVSDLKPEGPQRNRPNSKMIKPVTLAKMPNNVPGAIKPPVVNRTRKG